MLIMSKIVLQVFKHVNSGNTAYPVIVIERLFGPFDDAEDASSKIMQNFPNGSDMPEFLILDGSAFYPQDQVEDSPPSFRNRLKLAKEQWQELQRNFAGPNGKIFLDEFEKFSQQKLCWEKDTPSAFEVERERQRQKAIKRKTFPFSGDVPD